MRAPTLTRVPDRGRAAGASGRGARQLLSAGVAVIFVLPLWFMVVGSLRAPGLAPPSGAELWPRDPSLESYRRLPDLVPLATYLGNSALVVAVAVPVTVLVAAAAGFGVRLLAPVARRRAVIALVLLMTVPPSAVWASRFEVFRGAQAVDSYLPLVAPALAATSPFYVLVYVWVMGRVRQSQLDAARLEGASPLRLWARVVLPQCRPATLAVAMLAFTFHWSNVIDPLLYLESQDRYPLAFGLRFLQVLNPTDWPLLMAGAVILTLPTVVVFLVLQRFFLDELVSPPKARA